MNEFVSLAARHLEPLTKGYRVGRISHKDFVNGFYQVQETLDHLTKDVEQKYCQEQFKKGLDILGTDTCGFRTLDQLKERPFLSGNASTCLAVGIFDSNHGAAMAHINMYNPDHLRVYFDEEATPENITTIFKEKYVSLSNGERFDTFCSYVSLRAFEQYLLLNPSTEKKPGKVAIAGAGLEQIPRNQLPHARHIITSTLQTAFTDRFKSRIPAQYGIRLGSTGNIQFSIK